MGAKLEGLKSQWKWGVASETRKGLILGMGYTEEELQRPLIAVVFVGVGIAVSTFGLTGLIAKGYGTICWGFLVVYVLPMLTLGIMKIKQAGKV